MNIIFDFNLNWTSPKSVRDIVPRSGDLLYGTRDANIRGPNQEPITYNHVVGQYYDPSTCLHKTWPGFLHM